MKRLILIALLVAVPLFAGCGALKNIKDDPESYAMLISSGLVVAVSECSDKKACAERYYEFATHAERLKFLNAGADAGTLLDAVVKAVADSSMSVERQIFLENAIGIYRRNYMLPETNLPMPNKDAMEGFDILVQTIKNTSKRLMDAK